MNEDCQVQASLSHQAVVKGVPEVSIAVRLIARHAEAVLVGGEVSRTLVSKTGIFICFSFLYFLFSFSILQDVLCH